MTSLWLDEKGPGSYDEILQYIETVLEQNTYVAYISVSGNGEVDLRKRLARGMLYSILHRMGVNK